MKAARQSPSALGKPAPKATATGQMKGNASTARAADKVIGENSLTRNLLNGNDTAKVAAVRTTKAQFTNVIACSSRYRLGA